MSWFRNSTAGPSCVALETQGGIVRNGFPTMLRFQRDLHLVMAAGRPPIVQAQKGREGLLLLGICFFFQPFLFLLLLLLLLLLLRTAWLLFCFFYPPFFFCCSSSSSAPPPPVPPFAQGQRPAGPCVVAHACSRSFSGIVSVVRGACWWKEKQKSIHVGTEQTRPKAFGSRVSRPKPLTPSRTLPNAVRPLAGQSPRRAQAEGAWQG